MTVVHNISLAETPIFDGVLPLPTWARDMDHAALPDFAQFARRSLAVLQIWQLLQYAVTCTLCVVLVLYMRYNRHVAFRGDVNAARKILLPAFEPLLWILTFATALFATNVLLALQFDLYATQYPQVLSEFAYGSRQFVVLLVLVFMYQKSVSVPALRRTVAITLVMATYTVPIAYLVAHHSTTENSLVLYWVLRVSRGLIFVFYGYVCRYPPTRATIRSLRELGSFAMLYHALLFIANVLFKRELIRAGYWLMYAHLFCASLTPLIIWRVLKADTEHWRGMSQRACALPTHVLNPKAPHGGRLHERISSQGLHVLIEMHRKFIIDFAYLDIRDRIGVGASAVVFQGVLRSRTPVAVKVYTPSDFTDEVIAAFSHEAALCGTLTHHPNIVSFYGMCISPPTICLVAELCQGSLADITTARATGPQCMERPQFLIDLAYMIDAARAVAYLHSFSPPFLHRDIKPSNFLLDAAGTVKLTDFGESRSLTRDPGISPRVAEPTRLRTRSTSNAKPTLATTTFHSAIEMQVNAESPSSLTKMMTVRGTVDYMAPELICGRGGIAQYGEAADVYALAITMWDILHPGCEKYPALEQQHLRIFEAVLAESRPRLEPYIHPELRALIESSWHADSRQRPSAKQIVWVLERIQEEIAAGFALDFLEDMTHESDTTSVDVSDEIQSQSRPRHAAGCDAYTGKTMSDTMVALRYVESEAEALRLGHAMMDAGVLHHTKHSRGFETECSYFFDEEALDRYCALEGSPSSHGNADRGSSSSSSSSASVQSEGHIDCSLIVPPAFDSSMADMTPRTTCACRQLGQRVPLAKRPGFLRNVRGRKRLQQRQQQKFLAMADENVLTAHLLRNEEHSFSNRGGDRDYDEFPTGRSVISIV